MLTRHFTEHYAAQPPEQLGGVKGPIFNYLNAYTTPEVGALFCRDSTCTLDQVDQGKIFCLALPQRFAIERRFAGTFLKQLFYLHALRRFDRPAAERAKDNLLILWADEAQHFITAGEDGWSDYNAVDRIREARATAVFVTQSGTSFIPPVGKDKAKVLTLNLRNRLMFAAADEADAQAQAEFIGKRKRKKVTITTGKGGQSRSVSDEEEFRFKPHELRRLRKHQCVLVHCDRGAKKVVVPPLGPNGRVPDWFPWWRRWL